MGMPLDHQISEVVERLLRACRGDCIQMHEPAQRLRNFDIEQMRSVEPFVGRQHAGCHALRPLRSEQELEDGGRIDDHQRLSRSSRTTSVGDTRPR